MTDAKAGPLPLAAEGAAGTEGSSPLEPEPGTPVVPPTESVKPPPSKVFWGNLSHPFAAGFSLTLGGLAAIVVGLAISNLSTVMIYIVFALFAALGLDPLVRWLESHSVKRVWGIVIVYAAFALVLVGVLWLIIPTVVRQVAQFIRDIPSTITAFQQSDVYAWVQNQFGDQVGSLLTEAQTFLSNPANIAAIGGGVIKVGTTIATTLSGVIIILVLSLYFLASMPTIKQAFVRLVAARNRQAVSGITDQITDSVGGYLAGMVVLAFFNSVYAFILHLVLGLPFPALMAVVAFCITLIPLVGPVLYWIVATGLALFTSPFSALMFGILYLVYIQIEAYVITPRVMNRTISVPGSLVVIGALVGGTLLGLLGALVAIPVTASILLVIKQVFVPRQDAKT